MGNTGQGECVSRIGIMRPMPDGPSNAVTNGMGRYADRTPKELYLSSDNYIDIDRRSRLKIGGLFFDGLGWQATDNKTAFTESSDADQPFNVSLGDVKNTIRGDSGTNARRSCLDFHQFVAVILSAFFQRRIPAPFSLPQVCTCSVVASRATSSFKEARLA